MRLSQAQWDCLATLNKRTDGMMVNYGAGCGVKRNVVAALSGKGLAIYMPEQRNGVSARITDAGRLALSQRE